MINVGAMIINENAINVLYTVPASVEKYASPTGSVLIPFVFVAINGHKYEFQLLIIFNNAMDTIVGRDIGTITVNRYLISLHPSTLAAL